MADEDFEEKRRGSRRTRKKKVSIEARRTKEFTFRGLTLPELQALPIDQVAGLLPSRNRRFMSRMENREETSKLLKKMQSSEPGDHIRTHLRDFPVLPGMVERVVEVYNGKEFHKVTVQPEMIGHKLGEFAPTRKSVSHTGPGVGATRSSKFMPLK